MSYQTMRARLGARQGANAGHDKQAQLSKLGRLFRHARIAAKLLHEDVAMTAGVELSDIHRLETGSSEKGPTFETLVRIARALDMKLVLGLVPNNAAAPVTEEALVGESHDLRAVF
jgi:transcriptional regulator with XRE-family HTH domain